MNKLPAATALFALFLGACAPTAPVPRAAAAAAPKIVHPGLWRVADADTTIYLFGTIHVLPRDYVWQSPRLKQVADTADELVIETVIDQDPQVSARMLLGMGKAAGLPPLIERVSPDRRAALQDVITRSGLPPAVLDGMKTWTAAMMLVAVTLTDLGVEPQSGVEAQLRERFTERGRPVTGLEKPEEQLGYLDSLSEEDQRSFLETLVDNPNDGREKFAGMLAAWSRGDEQAIAATFDNEPEMTPKLREVLLDRRNVTWSNWLAKRLDTPGTILVAVGAGHLAGSESVQARLKAKGFTVTRVE
ncbi:MAG: GumN family protein [Sphingomonas bacterium]|nr:GumN family protein [Sphingomonas bacterium]